MLINHVEFDTETKVTASYYPGRGQTMHPLAAFPTVPPTITQGLDLAHSASDDISAKSEEEWSNDWHVAGLAEQASCISGALSNKVC